MKNCWRVGDFRVMCGAMAAEVAEVARSRKRESAQSGGPRAGNWCEDR